ncbi:unannotated protein [freshwater metagenome]|uniref:Unannotated protein n=1 Tax=freshwater metagenome TaxID=449393 RepID=A0A6J7FN50_9ZZZZ|nr:hypothetical protein [Actinomycetota bacterium]
MPTAVLTTHAELLAKVPVATFIKSGDLRLANDRLSFTTIGGEVLLDAPIDEIHSVAPAAVGLHLWHGSRCLRFAFRESRDLAASWITTLTPLVSAPPSTLRVPPPWPKWAWMLTVVAVTAMLVVAIIALTTLNN